LYLRDAAIVIKIFMCDHGISDIRPFDTKVFSACGDSLLSFHGVAFSVNDDNDITGSDGPRCPGNLTDKVDALNYFGCWRQRVCSNEVGKKMSISPEANRANIQQAKPGIESFMSHVSETYSIPKACVTKRVRKDFFWRVVDLESCWKRD
jgi:hypothetical protein